MNTFLVLCILSILLCICLSASKFKIVRLAALIGSGVFILMAVGIFTGNFPDDAANAADTNAPSFFPADEVDLEVNFLDVGQGLAVLIREGSHYMLYDGGGRDTAEQVVSVLEEKGVKKLDYITASHYDADHIGGLIEALYSFDVDRAMGPDYIIDSAAADYLKSKLSQLNIQLEHPKPGNTFTLGRASFQILSPGAGPYEEENDYSLAIRITGGDLSVILMGDAGKKSETDILKNNNDLSADVLCAGHHGSSSSTTTDFLKRVNPSYIIISCGKDNTFGHPHRSMLSRIKEINAGLYRTDLQGTVTLYSDGTKIHWSTEPSTDYTPGVVK